MEDKLLQVSFSDVFLLFPVQVVQAMPCACMEEHGVGLVKDQCKLLIIISNQ